MNCFSRVFLPALLLGLLPLSAQAADCGGLKPVMTVKLENDGYNRAIVPVTVNGVPKKFLFDTGGVLTQVSPALVNELKLTTQTGEHNVQDVNGYASDKTAKVDNFTFGAFKAENLRLQVATLGDEDGILTPVMFKDIDIDIDFGPRRLNVFLADHCPGKVVYWKTDGAAAVPVVMRNNHFNLDVTVDGHVLRGIIDTGASGTFLSAAAAHHIFGLTTDSPGMEPGGYVNGDKETPSYHHTFSSLSFEGVRVANPRVLIQPDRTGAHDRNNDVKTGSMITHEDDDMRNPQIIVGMNVLSKLHIYFATKEKKLYISAAGPPDAPPPFEPPKL